MKRGSLFFKIAVLSVMFTVSVAHCVFAVQTGSAEGKNEVAEAETMTADTSNPSDLSSKTKSTQGKENGVEGSGSSSDSKVQGNPDAELNYDSQYPLKGQLQNLGLDMVYAEWLQSTVYYWSDAYQSYRNEGVIPSDVYMERCQKEKTLRYFNMPEDNDSILAVAILADMEDVTFPYANKSRAEEIAENLREFFQIFPNWREADDYEKAVHIVNWLKQAQYQSEEKTVTAKQPYGCLVEKEASDKGFTNTAKLLGLCVGLDVMSGESRQGNECPVFEINGVWMAYEPELNKEYFTVYNVYTLSDKNEKLGNNLYDTYIEDHYFRAENYELPEDLNTIFSEENVIWVKYEENAEEALILYDACGNSYLNRRKQVTTNA